MSKLFRNVPLFTSLEVSLVRFVLLFLFIVGLARREARRSLLGWGVQGVAEGEANDRGARDACFSTARRTASRHGWFAGGTHFRFLIEIATCGRALWAAGRRTGLAGAGISRQHSGRPRYSIARLPCRPSHTNTLLRAGAEFPLCGSSWKKRLP